MKKFSCILLSSILLVGCSSYSETKVVATSYVEDYDKDDVVDNDYTSYYKTEEHILNQTKQVGNELYKKYRDLYYFEPDSSGYQLDVEWEMFQENNLVPGESEWAKKLDAVFPGIEDFMKKIDGETTNKNPQSIVINNATIRVKPAHLYEDVDRDRGRTYNYSSYMSIENEPIVLVDDYFKQIAEVIPNDKFAVHEPYVMGQTKLLRFSTPAFRNRSYMTLQDEKGIPSVTYFEEGAVGYQLFIADNEIQKIRVMFNKIKDEKIDIAYFDPLIEWCKNEWHMEDSELTEVNQLINRVIEADKGKQKGRFGDYQYSYTAKNDRYFRYHSGINASDYKGMLVEFVIESK